jgi:hypothetical protein
VTKGELIKSLAGVSDDQYVMVLLSRKDCPGGAQLAIQRIETIPPWHEAKPDQSNWLVGILVADDNR